MRIGVNLLFLRPGKVGGSETYVRALLREMAARADEPLTLFCFDDAAVTFDTSPRLQVVPCARAPYSARRRLAAETLALASAVRAHRIDVLFSPGNYAPALLPVRVPQVATVLDLQHLALPQNFTLPRRLARSLLFRTTFLRCRLVLSISNFTREQIIDRYRLLPERVIATQLGPDVSDSPPPTETEAARAAHRLAAPYLCYPAMAAPHKNHAVLFRALGALRKQGLPAPELVLTGAPNDALARLLPDAAAQGIADRIRPLGYLPRRELHAVLAGASALVYPSRFEGFGLPLLEAMRLGVPVISSVATSLAEVAGDAALLLSPDDVAGWAAAIHRVMEDQALRQRLVAAGAANLGRFSWERCAEETLAALASAAGGSAGSGGRVRDISSSK